MINLFFNKRVAKLLNKGVSQEELNQILDNAKKAKIALTYIEQQKQEIEQTALIQMRQGETPDTVAVHTINCIYLNALKDCAPLNNKE